MRFLFLLLGLAISISLAAQDRYTISGLVKDKATGESIIRASVIVSGQHIGVTTNDYGYYSLTLPAGKYTLLISSAGRQSQTIDVDLKQNVQLSTQLGQQA